MNSQDQPSPNQDPNKPGTLPGEKGKQDQRTNPGKPGNDPDQTPEREVNNPPVADPKKNPKPNKPGFKNKTNQIILF